MVSPARIISRVRKLIHRFSEFYRTNVPFFLLFSPPPGGGPVLVFLFFLVQLIPFVTQLGNTQGVCSVDEHFADWIVARERVGRIVPNFHIAMEMSLSSSHVGLHG